MDKNSAEKKMSAKQLLDFVISLNDRGLLSKNIEEFDYEKMIWEHLKCKHPPETLAHWKGEVFCIRCQKTINKII